MAIGIYEAIQSLRPGIRLGADYELQDDGNGAYISSWTFGQPKPTDAEIAAEIARLIPLEPAKIAGEQRHAAYINEADPLFFKAQRGEATIDEWKAKVAEIKARFPKEQA